MNTSRQERATLDGSNPEALPGDGILPASHPMSYAEFLADKVPAAPSSGIEPDDGHPSLYPFQQSIVRWAVRRGRAAVFADCGLGKAQPDDERILSPSGWRTIGDICVGDEVIGVDGKPTKVAGVYPQGIREIWRVTMSDGSTTRCDPDHLWTVAQDNDIARGVEWRTLTLREIVSTGLGMLTTRPTLRWRVPVMDALELPEREYSIDPYVLGVLLGDGHLTEGEVTFCSVDPEIVAAVGGRLPERVGLVATRETRVPTFRLSTHRAGNGHRNPLFVGLREMDLVGKRSHNKFIPPEYQLGSTSQRLELLRGLMDTDGYVSDDGCVQFGTSSAELAHGVTELVRGLGGVTRETRKLPTYTYLGEKRTGRLHHTLTMRLPNGLIPFRLERKAARIATVQKYAPTRKIASVELDGQSPARCIQVEHPNGLYVTADHIVTHNTRIQLDWARQIGGRVLIVAPLAVAEQTIAEAQLMDLTVQPVEDASSGIVITNYERLHKLNPNDYRGIVLDECFAAGTKIDTPTGRKHIEAIRIGDEIINASGVDVVADVHRREVPYAVRVTVAGQAVVSSPNHPYFTQRGWVTAQNLKPGDSLVPTAEAMRMVRQGVPEEVGTATEREQILQSILLSEMADAPTRGHRQGSQSTSGSEARSFDKTVAGVRIAAGVGADRARQESEPPERSGGTGEDLPHIESDEVGTFRAWGKWSRDDRAAAIDAGCTWTDLGRGVGFVTGRQETGISDLLQARLSATRDDDRYRGGWILPCEPSAPGREEGRDVGFSRVDGLEVLEPGHPELDQWRDANGKLYFYDLGATRHPSYSIAGHLVHNSSILKSIDGKTRTRLLTDWTCVPYRLCCTATPAPNDISELANHAEFLGIMSRVEMLASFFVHDENTWRMKGHAKERFWEWLTTWALYVRKPSNIGYSDEGFVLPPLTIRDRVVPIEAAVSGELFPHLAKGIQGRSEARRASIDGRVEMATEEVMAHPDDQFLIWCGLNDEGHRMADALGKECVLVEGADSDEHKISAVHRWRNGEIRVLICKAAMFGFGLNFQHCNRMIFLGIGDSYESYYQSLRRCWRFGQRHPVDAVIIVSEAESVIPENVRRKEHDVNQTMDEVAARMSDLETAAIKGAERRSEDYREDEASGDGWRMMLGDSTVRLKEIETASVGLSVFSPPFASLFTYSASDRDLGNSRDYDEFFTHFAYIIAETLRVTKPGRRSCVHVQQVTTTKATHGVIGWRDFRADTVRAFLAAGWVYDGEVVIDKDPQAQAIRTKSKALMFVQKNKDSAWSRPAMADYILLFRAPGDNAEPVKTDVSNEEWILWARPIWYGIRETETLNARAATTEKDEKHIAPLQLETIERCVRLWSNPGDMVLSPFGGIGSEGYVALQHGRRYTGIELKSSYFEQACRNLRSACVQSSLFSEPVG